MDTSRFPTSRLEAISLAVELAGFKAYRQHGIELTAGQIRSVGELRLSVGDMAESVTVESDIAFVALASGEKSGVITNSDLENTAIRGRDYLDMLRLRPAWWTRATGARRRGRTASATSISMARGRTRRTSPSTA